MSLPIDPCLCLLFILENPSPWTGLPAFPNSAEGPAPWLLWKSTQPLEIDAKECPQSGREVGRQGFPLWDWDSLCLKAPHALITNFGFVSHQLTTNFQDGKVSAYNAGDPGSILGSGRSPGEGNGNPLQYSCQENPWTEEPGWLQSMRSQRVGHDWATSQLTMYSYPKQISDIVSKRNNIDCFTSHG